MPVELGNLDSKAEKRRECLYRPFVHSYRSQVCQYARLNALHDYVYSHVMLFGRQTCGPFMTVRICSLIHSEGRDIIPRSDDICYGDFEDSPANIDYA